MRYLCVIPAKAGIQTRITFFKLKFIDWIPAYAGMTTYFAASSAVLDRLIKKVIPLSQPQSLLRDPWKKQ